MKELRKAEAQGGYYLPAMLLAVVFLPAVLGSSQAVFMDGDVSWHIATGQWIIDHRAVPHTDPFSFTWAGKPWVPIEWIAEVMMAEAHRLAGYSGIAALVTAALIALHAIIFFNATRFIRPLMALGTLIAMDVALIPAMLARPHLLAWPLIAFWTWLMLRAREKGKAPPLPAALLLVLWANFHGSFVIGLAIAGAFGLEDLVTADNRARTIRDWSIFGLACLLAVFVNANGIEGVLHPLHIVNLAMLPLIQEWQPSSPSRTPWFFAVLAATLMLVLLKRPRLPAVRWLLLAGLLAFAMLQMRQQSILAIMAAMLLPQGFAGRHVAPLTERRMVRLLALAAVAMVLVRAILPMKLSESGTQPWRLIAAVPPELRSKPVLNGYSMGGPLILSGIRPYIDGRGDMYGDELVVDYAKILEGDRGVLDRAVRQWDIRWAILPNNATSLIGLLNRTPGWRQIYRDDVGVIYVRD